MSHAIPGETSLLRRMGEAGLIGLSGHSINVGRSPGSGAPTVPAQDIVVPIPYRLEFLRASL